MSLDFFPFIYILVHISITLHHHLEVKKNYLIHSVIYSFINGFITLLH